MHQNIDEQQVLYKVENSARVYTKKKTIKAATYKSTVVGGTIGIRARKWWLQRTVGPACVL